MADPRDIGQGYVQNMPAPAPLQAPQAPPPGPADVVGTAEPFKLSFEPQQPQTRAIPFSPTPRVGGGPSVNVDLSGMNAPGAAPPPQAPPADYSDVRTRARAILSPGRYQAPGWQNGTRSMVEAPGFSEAEMAPYAQAMGQSTDHMTKAAESEYQAAQAKAKVDAYYANTRMEEEQKYAQERAAIEASKKLYIQQSFEDLDKRSQAIASARVNPEQFWEDSGGGIARVFAAIAVGLGQIGAAKTGGQNAALQVINGAIDRNIDAQKANLSKMHTDYEMRRNLVAQNIAAFGDEESGLLASKVNYLEQAKAFFDQQYAKIDGGPGAEAARERMLASISSQQAAYKEAIAERMHTRQEFNANQHWNPGGYVGGASAGKEDPLLVQAPDGTVYRARTEKEAQQARALEAAYENMSNVLNEASRTRKATGAHEYAGSKLGIDSENIAKLKSLSAQAVLGVKNAEEMGALDKGAAEFGGETVGNYSNYLGNPEARGEAYLDMIRKKRDNFRRAQGSQVRQQVLIPTARGDYAESSVGMPAANMAPKDIKTRKIGAK